MGSDGGRKDNNGILGNSHKRAAISWARRGSEIGQSFTFFMLRCKMRPQHLLLYDKMMVIWLGDGLYQVD
jgi:hypothetical protein